MKNNLLFEYMYSNKKVSVFGALSPGYTSYCMEVIDCNILPMQNQIQAFVNV